MIGPGHIGYGAVLFAVAAAAVVILLQPQRVATIVASAVVAGAGPPEGSAIVRATHASTFRTDAPIAVLPASWQDRAGPARRVATAALLTGVAMFPVAVSLS
jgi:hypothetical protein